MTSTEVAHREPQTPKAMVQTYADSFAAVLPSHIAKPETWIRIAQGALKKGKRTQDGRTELEVAAANNPGVFLATLLDAARLGLEPGTEQYYLTARKVKGQLEILGIVGYQGEIELIYRAGAVSSVVAECVYSNDVFSYSPGEDPFPRHQVDWFGGTRGKLIGVYAFARMKDGSTSKAVVLGEQDIERAKKSAQNPGGEYSPWRNHPDAMWLKTAVHALKKWVPTSAEYREVMRDQRVKAEDVAASGELPIAPEDLPSDEYVPSDDEVADAVEVCSDCRTELTDNLTCPKCEGDR